MRKSYYLFLCFISVSLSVGGVWKETFDSGMPKGREPIVGKWKVDEKALTETSSEAYSKIMFGNVAWRGYSIAGGRTKKEKTAIGSGSAQISTWGRFPVGLIINTSTLKPQFHPRQNRARLIV